VRSSTSSGRRTLAPDLAQRVLDGEREAVSEALNLADDRRPDRRAAALALLDALEQRTPFPGASRVGITGPPGAGKSTLLDALVRELRPRGESVAIVAVDPSSRQTGGALLGDRFRVRSGAGDPGVFIRSMAARERLGGLADATRAGVVILAAAFDHVFVETVGVGQSEVDVASLVDTLVYVAHPEAGDALQFMKAGILEFPDLFVVNKADLGESAQRTARELETSLGANQPGASDASGRVLLISARDAGGIDALVAALGEHRQQQQASGELRERRLRSQRSFVLETLENRYGSFGLDALGGRKAVESRVEAAKTASAFALAARLGDEIEERLRQPA
jgi:LAO/AO transport system kinase